MPKFADKIYYFMKRVQVKRNYIAPASNSTAVTIEKALLVATATLLLNVDETQNMNARSAGSDEPGGAMYFEF